jgi:CubicO group peptidase (beta-lactamase class C family)
MALPERMAHYRVPGISIAVVQDGEIEWAKGYGLSSVGGETLVTTETCFEAGSTTKLLTSVLVLCMVERRQLDLDEDVNAYLRSCQVPEDDFTREQKVTLRLLLTHQSGLPSGGFSWEEGSVPSLVQVVQGQAPAENQAAVPEFAPGARWQYSNLGYVLIQLLLEDVTGTPLAQLAQQEVFEPLGMTSSTLIYPLPLGVPEAVPHDAEGKAHPPAMHPTALAQGGLMTTPSDLARLAIELADAYQGRSDRVLSPARVRRMFRPELALDPAILGVPLGQGLGVFLRGQTPDFSILHPGGNDPGATCWLEAFPASGHGAAIMTNGAKGDLLSLEILAAIAEEYGWPPAQ